MKKYFSIIIIFLVLTGCGGQKSFLVSDGFEGKDYYTYYGTTADTAQASWERPPNYIAGQDYFDIKLYNPERDIEIIIAEAFDGFTIEFKCPKTGHWVVRLRTARQNQDQTWLYSEWIESIDSNHATVDGQPRAWWLFSWVASTGPIEF